MENILRVSKNTEPSKLSYKIIKSLDNNDSVSVCALGDACAQLMKSLCLLGSQTGDSGNYIITPYCGETVCDDNTNKKLFSILITKSENLKSIETKVIEDINGKSELNSTINHFGKLGYKLVSHTCVVHSKNIDTFSCIFQRNKDINCN